MFSILTSKVFGGLSIALLLAIVAITLTKNAEISRQAKEIKSLKDATMALALENKTLLANQATLEGGLKSCNAGVDAVASKTAALAKAGANAVADVKRAGQVAVAARAREIDAMPKNSCDDALAILKAGGV